MRCARCSRRPPRQEAPEPNAWLPIDLTSELAALDLTGELELLEIEEGRVDLDRELAELEADFWRTAEHEHPFLTGVLPTAATGAGLRGAGRPDRPRHRRARAEHRADRGARTRPRRAHPSRCSRPPPPSPRRPLGPHRRPRPRPSPSSSSPTSNRCRSPRRTHSCGPTGPAIAHRRRALRLRHRLIVTALVVACGVALVGVAAQVVGGTHPRRDITVSVDGRASTIVTRAGTVGDLLASEGVVLRAGDRVVPSTTTALEQGMPIHVFRAFPMTADVDGTVVAHRTTHHDSPRIRRELNVPAALVRVDGHGRVARGTTMVLRTPHDVVLVARQHEHPVAPRHRPHRR